MTELYTYCVIDEKEKNLKVKLGTTEFKNWKKRYREDFEKSYIDFGEEPLDIQRYYCDPDTTYKCDPRTICKEGCNHDFFHYLESFLTKRERDFHEELQGTFTYKFVKNKGIEVSKTDKDVLFYLRSDQLGFSAPSNEKSHPYDLYIMESQDKDAAIKKVADWIATSRTIGGSFLWPRPFYDKYNPRRGGKITSDRQYYIQDRVDLTLWELLYWYEKPEKNTIMRRCENECGKETSNLDIWLNHFKDFPTYIKFFHFEDFVKGDKPINILTGKTEEPHWGPNGENPEIEITRNTSNDIDSGRKPSVDADELEEMLKCLSKKIENRSLAMLEINS